MENNLYGLDIDDRAGQLAYFAVMMKARKYNRRILNSDVKPNVMAIQDSGFMTDDLIAYVANKDARMKADLTLLRSTFKDAKEYGSILNVPKLNYAALYERIDIIGRSFAEDIFQIEYQSTATEKLLPLVKQAEVMAQKYDVVVTNPPYMGASGMSAKLANFVKEYYPDSKSDLFAVFIEKCGMILKRNGYQAMITQHAWMFLGSYENLRKKLLSKITINMAHLGARAFEEIGGEVVQTTSFVLSNRNETNYRGTYCRLIEPTSQQGKEDMFLSGSNRHTPNQSNFKHIPGNPIAYWISKNWCDLYSNNPILRDYATLKKGTSTGDNNRFIRQWFEVPQHKICFSAHNPNEAISSGQKWFPINGGGERRKWYGNRFDVVNWENDGAEMKALATKLNHGGHWSRYIINPDRFFTEAIGWSAISTSKISVRYIGYGFAFSSAAMEAFGNNLKYIMSLINSVVADDILKVLAPTINFGVEQVGKIPVNANECKTIVENIADANIELSKDDWDAFETSWDFKKHPLV